MFLKLVTKSGIIFILALFCAFLASSAYSYADGGGYSWTNKTSGTGLSSLLWYGLATSASGQDVIAVAAGNDIYQSTNYGSTWTDLSPSGSLHSLNWSAVSMSANGQVIAAVVDGGDIYVSTNGGSTWTDTTASGSTHNQEWFDVAVSANGQVIAAGDQTTGDIYTSINNGSTWTNQTTGTALSGQNWYSISSSANGKILTAANYGHDLYISTNSGSSWTDLTPSGSLHNSLWESVAMSANGQDLVALAENGDIYTSVNEGSTWADTTPSGGMHGLQYFKVTSSANGQDLTAAVLGGDIYSSTNGGSTWADTTPSGTGHNISWNALAASTSGQYVYGGTENGTSGDIYAAVNPTLASTSSASLTNAITGAAVSINLPSSTTMLTSDSAATEGSLANVDSGYTYPIGLINLSYLTLNTTDQISIIFVTSLTPSQVVARDYNSVTQSYSNISGAVITQTTYNGLPALELTYSITDNGSLDSNSALDYVTDPVGIAESTSIIPSSPNTGYGQPIRNTAIYELSFTSLLFITAGTLISLHKNRQ